MDPRLLVLYNKDLRRSIKKHELPLSKRGGKGYKFIKSPFPLKSACVSIQLMQDTEMTFVCQGCEKSFKIKGTGHLEKIFPLCLECVP